MNRFCRTYNHNKLINLRTNTPFIQFYTFTLFNLITICISNMNADTVITVRGDLSDLGVQVSIRTEKAPIRYEILIRQI